ncbi:MAG: formylglycine-generating enzyme family protein, partial [Planctomycetaceae bacterium]
VGPGGQGTPNSWGLHDMLGNVAEICRDSYRDELTSGTDPLADFSGDPVVIRGGSWKSSLPNCRPAWRDRWGRKHRSEWLGFRLVLVKVPPELLVKR